VIDPAPVPDAEPAPVASAVPAEPALTRAAPIAAGGLLLHVGMPKTGSTAVQTSAARGRAALREQGVTYPGRATNHRAAVFGLAGMHDGWGGETGGSVPSLRHWHEVVRESKAAPDTRALVSHELIADLGPAEWQRMIDDLGRAPHVLLTLRTLPGVLSSTYQQRLKIGRTSGFPAWLHAVLDPDPTDPEAPLPSRRLDHAGIVRAFADLVGADNVTVVVLSPTDRGVVPGAFESLLDLRPGTLAPVELTGADMNRSLTLPEAALVRAVNKELRANPGLTWQHYDRFYVGGGIARVLAERTPPEQERRIMPPAWAAQRALEIAERNRAAIAASGVRVIGDLDDLVAPVPVAAGRQKSPRRIPLDLARVAVAGTLSAAAGFDHDFGASRAAAVSSAEEPSNVSDRVRRSAMAEAVRLVEPVPTSALALGLLGRAARAVADLPSSLRRR
jgi:hypothetical protein